MRLASSSRRLGTKHARGRTAGLPGVLHHQADAVRYGPLEIGIVEDDIGALAAEFLVDTFDRRRSRAGYFDTGARGAGNGDHGDIRMCSHGGANHRSFTLHQVENARR